MFVGRLIGSNSVQMFDYRLQPYVEGQVNVNVQVRIPGLHVDAYSNELDLGNTTSVFVLQHTNCRDREYEYFDQVTDSEVLGFMKNRS
jgi:hypothetical protein